MKKNYLNPLFRLMTVVLALLAGSFTASAADINVYGDVNLDGEVTVADVNSVIDVILNNDIIPTADVNSDGEINIADVNTLIDIILNGGIDPFLKVCEKVADINYEIKDYYKKCSSLEELKEYAGAILAIEGVEDVYFNEHTTMFVEIKGFPTLSYSYYPKTNYSDVAKMLQRIKVNIEADLQDENTSYTPQKKYDKDILIVNQQSWEDRTFQNEQMVPGLQERFSKAGFKCPIINNSPDVDFFRDSIFDCDYLFLLTHGKYDPKKKLHWLSTAEEIRYNDKGKIDPAFLQKYKDYKEGEQVQFDMETEGHHVVCVSEKFIETSTKQFNHPGQAIVFNTACESLKGPNPSTLDSINYDLASVFRQKGAATYLGYDATNTAGPSAGLEFFERLLSGMSVESAFDDLSFMSRHNRMHGEKGDFWADLRCTVKTKTCINQPEITYIDSSDDNGLRIDLFARNFFERYITWQKGTIDPETGEYDINHSFIVSNEELRKLPFRYGFELSESEQFTELIPLDEKRIGDEGCTWDENYGKLDGSNFYYMLALSQSLTYNAFQSDSKIKPNATYWARAYIYDGHGYNYSEPITFTTKSMDNDRLLILSKNVNGTEYSLYTRVVNPNDKHVNGDGTIFYRNQIILDVANGDGIKTYIVDDEVYLPQDYSNQQQFFAMLLDLIYGQLHIFCNSKTPADNNGMNGFNYVTPLNNIDFTKETVFANQNWGRWPFYMYNEGQIFIRHFNFNGNYYMLSTRDLNGGWSTIRKNRMNPDAFEQMWEQAEHFLIVEPDGPYIHIDEDSIDFGNVIIGSIKAVELKIINSSDAVKTVTATVDDPFSFSQNDSGIKDKTITVSGNSYYPLKIYFTATEFGNYKGNIVLRSNAIEGGLCVISLEAHVETVESLTQTITVNGVSFTVIGVEGGIFMMGSNDDIDEIPIHKVTLSSFAIGQTEVTQELWQAVMGSNPSWYKGDLKRPVEHVSWHDCWTFIRKLNEMTGKSFRLPTEAEWEFAARGGNLSHGYKFSGSDDIAAVAWIGQMPTAVGSKAPNELGLYDMSGNVSEWVQDWFDNYKSNDQINPRGPSCGDCIVYRGGDYMRGQGCEVSSRRNDYPMNSDMCRGLRLAVSDGPEPDPQCGYVDLGLPSGTLWATMNIGATSPEEYGDYFAWGEILPKEVYNWGTYKWCNGSYDTMTKYGTDNNGVGDGKIGLDPEDDAAYMNWGPSWRMPTENELYELSKICTWKWISLYGVNGYLATGPNGNSLFFPAAGRRVGSSLSNADLCGYYWSCTVGDSYNRHCAYLLSLNSGNVELDVYARGYGHSVRAVHASQDY